MRLLLIALLLGVAGCSTVSGDPTEADIKASWEEKNVPPADYKGDILAFMRTYLNNPTQIRDAAVSAPFRKEVGTNPGERYIACLRYNARKSDGKYAGSKTAVVVY